MGTIDRAPEGYGQGGVEEPVHASVVIPCYNAAETIGEQLEALAGQVCERPWEVLVADNGSRDATREVVERFRERLPRLRLVDASDHRGAGHARNVGARHARGEVLLFCDADDVVGEGWVAAMCRALDSHDFVCSRYDGERLNSALDLARRVCPQQSGVQPYRHPPYLPHAGGGGLGVRRRLHEQVGGYDETLYKLQDTDYCWQVQLAGAELAFVPDAVVHIRYRGAPSASYKQAREWGEYNVRIYKKYRPHGMPRLSAKKGVRNWVRLVKRLPELRDGSRRVKWLWELNWMVGRVVGSLKYRVVAI